jgi:CO/xanthine dehydrogenase FAD-binding subunit
LKPPAFAYAAPTSIDEALALLEAHGEDARFLAGGQSLMPALNFRLASPSALIDLNTVTALAGVSTDAQGNLVAGAMTRHRFFETSDLIARGWPLLHHAMASVAHVAIRNRGTLGGSLCHADPSAEWPALCLASGAWMILRSRAGRRRVAAAEFSRGLFATALAPGELLEQVVFPAWPPTRRWGFQEIARRRGDFAIAGVACLLDVAPDGRCAAARIVVFGVADGPILMADAATSLIGIVPDDRAVRTAAERARHGAVCRADHHASAEYRAELVEALTARALAQALAGAAASSHA